MGYSPEDIRILTQRRAQQAQGATFPVKEGWQGGVLTIFCPGTPKHFKGRGQRFTVSRHTRTWRERATGRLLPHAKPGTWPWPWLSNQPKRIVFTVYGSNSFDDDNLEIVCSPVRDGLKDGRIINDDRKSAGHTFCYAQVPSRKPGAVHGIAVEITLLTKPSASV